MLSNKSFSADQPAAFSGANAVCPATAGTISTSPVGLKVNDFLATWHHCNCERSHHSKYTNSTEAHSQPASNAASKWLSQIGLPFKLMVSDLEPYLPSMPCLGC